MAARGDGSLRPEVRWTLGCLIGSVALVGVLILVLLVAIALQPPTWIQISIGVMLALGGALFAWLVASALGEARVRRDSGEDAEKVSRLRPRS